VCTAKRICKRLFHPYEEAAEARRRAEQAEQEAAGMVDLYNEVHEENMRLREKYAAND
jgi:hypothetical protein